MILACVDMKTNYIVPMQLAAKNLK
jgi:hypothetical protein